MKQFIVHLSEKQSDLMTQDLIQDHVDYLRQLKEKNLLSFCGPCKDGTAIMILSCDSRDEAQQLVDNDPFSAVDYYIERRIVEVEEPLKRMISFFRRYLIIWTRGDTICADSILSEGG